MAGAELMIDIFGDELAEEWHEEPLDSDEDRISVSGISDTGSCVGTGHVKTSGASSDENRTSVDGQDEDNGTVVVKQQPKTPEWKRLIMDRLGNSPANVSKDLFTPSKLEALFTPPTANENIPPASEGRPGTSDSASSESSPTKKATTPSNGHSNKSQFQPKPSRLSALQEINEATCSEQGGESSLIQPIAHSTLRSTIRTNLKMPDFEAGISTDGKDKELTKDNLNVDSHLLTPGATDSAPHTPSHPANLGSLTSEPEEFGEIKLQAEKTAEGRTIYTPAPSRQSNNVPVLAEDSPMPSYMPSSPPWIAKGKGWGESGIANRLLDQQRGRRLASPFTSKDGKNIMSSTPVLPPPLPDRNISHLHTPQPQKPRRMEEQEKGDGDLHTPFFTPFPNLHSRRGSAEVPKTPRTPSPSKRATAETPGRSPGKRKPPGSPLKLFAEKPDTFTKSMIDRRMSQFELETAESPPRFDKRDVEENAVDDEDGESTTEAGVKRDTSANPRKSQRVVVDITENAPLLPPKIRSQPAQAIKVARRPRSQTTNSNSSCNANDGIRAPKSPMKDRTPKRLRRSLSGSYEPNGRGEILPSRERHRPRKSEPISEIKTPAETINESRPSTRRERSPSPTPLREGASLLNSQASPTPVVTDRKKATPVSRRQVDPPSSGGLPEFKGVPGGGPLDNTGFDPCATPASTDSRSTRKGSVTTQDFLSQAEEVMQRIRKGGLGVLRKMPNTDKSQQSKANQGSQGDDLDNNSFGLADFDQTTRLSERPSQLASRPISRSENRSKMVGFNNTEDNVYPVNRRQEEGRWDTGDSSSLILLPLSDENNAGDPSSNGENNGTSSLRDKHSLSPDGLALVVSPKGGNTSRTQQRQVSIDSSIRTNALVKISSHTTSRQISGEGIHVIRPLDVQHLLQERVGEMAFDKEQKYWRKQKEALEHSLSEDSEDPFAGVSDLQIDEDEKEASALMKDIVNELEEFVMNSEGEDEGDQSLRILLAHKGKEEGASKSQPEERPQESLSKEQEQRAQTEIPKSSPGYSQFSEIQIPSRDFRRVSFMDSSPTKPFAGYESKALGEWADSMPEGSDYLLDQSYANPRTKGKGRFSLGNSSIFRRTLTGNKAILGRSRVEVDLQSSTHSFANLHNSFRRMSVSSALTPLPTPWSQRLGAERSMIPPAPSSVKTGDVSFHMSSPLPELSYRFEATEALLNLELTHVAQRKGLAVSNRRELEQSFSVAVDTLVRHLTDVEPFEPYWDCMKYLKLAGRGLTTLHGLQDWCSRIEELDVSDNEIGQLSGVPNSVRTLKIPNNLLSGLTAWSHLTNLQYVDISKNRIDSLASLRHMVHLRELRADDNEIDSLDGIQLLDGLLSLRMRRNRIKHLDFENTCLTRLSELDLRGNGLESISGLENLPSLSTLNLDENRLETLNTKGLVLDSIRQLKLMYNNFESFDVAPFPNLRILMLDDNRLTDIRGLKRAKHIDTLSIKNQQLPEDAHLPEVADMYEIRKLYLSRNPYRSLHMPLDFMNLQYLELANTQMTALPKEFGHMMSNTRVLNLNYNALSDIRPLFGMCRLKKLLLVGNRITSMRKTASVFQYFPHLSTLDLRLNPLTLGFYPPQSATPQFASSEDDAYPPEPFILQDASEEQDIEYRARVDIETAILRRRYEVWCAKELKRLKKLDGLVLQKEKWKGDAIWAEMIRRGLIIDEASKNGVKGGEDAGGADEPKKGGYQDMLPTPPDSISTQGRSTSKKESDVLSESN